MQVSGQFTNRFQRLLWYLATGNKRSAEPTSTARFHNLQHPEVGKGMALLNIFLAL